MLSKIDLCPRFIVNASDVRTDVVLTMIEFETLLSIAQAKQELERKPPAKTLDIYVFCMPRKNLLARGHWHNQKFYVLENSEAAQSESTMSARNKKLRQQLRSSGVLIEVNGRLIFSKDWPFESPSQAASIVAGGSRSGPAGWTKNSETLGERSKR